MFRLPSSEGMQLVVEFVTPHTKWLLPCFRVVSELWNGSHANLLCEICVSGVSCVAGKCDPSSWSRCVMVSWHMHGGRRWYSLTLSGVTSLFVCQWLLHHVSTLSTCLAFCVEREAPGFSMDLDKHPLTLGYSSALAEHGVYLASNF